jgi:hypothetical protein
MIAGGLNFGPSPSSTTIIQIELSKNTNSLIFKHNKIKWNIHIKQEEEETIYKDIETIQNQWFHWFQQKWSNQIESNQQQTIRNMFQTQIHTNILLIFEIWMKLIVIWWYSFFFVVYCGESTDLQSPKECDGGSGCNKTTCQCERELGYIPLNPIQSFCFGCGNGLFLVSCLLLHFIFHLNVKLFDCLKFHILYLFCLFVWLFYCIFVWWIDWLLQNWWKNMWE